MTKKLSMGISAHELVSDLIDIRNGIVDDETYQKVDTGIILSSLDDIIHLCKHAIYDMQYELEDLDLVSRKHLLKVVSKQKRNAMPSNVWLVDRFIETITEEPTVNAMDINFCTYCKYGDCSSYEHPCVDCRFVLTNNFEPLNGW